MSNRQQEYYLKNRERIISKVLERYHANIEEMHEKRKETTTCDCGIVVRKDSFAKHKKCKQHLKFMETH